MTVADHDLTNSGEDGSGLTYILRDDVPLRPSNREPISDPKRQYSIHYFRPNCRKPNPNTDQTKYA